MDHSEHRSLSAWTSELSAFGYALYRAQPCMAPLFNLVNHTLLAVESAPTLAKARHRGRRALQGFLQQLERSQEALIAAALPLLPSSARLLTFSYSSTVLAVLLEARARRIPFSVLCTEGRPMLEGQRLAQRLAEAGVPVRFGVDAAVVSFASQASLAFIGADSITHDGVVNKLGTRGVAHAARAAGVPCYVLCGREKWWPLAAGSLDPSHLQPTEEVWVAPPAGVEVWNAYFESIPLDLFRGVIAEGGVLEAREVREALTAIPVAASLSLTAFTT